jgi:hypothetical protein
MQAVAQSAADRAIPAAAVCDEHALVGRRVLKKFKGYGTHAGTIAAFLPAGRSPTHDGGCFLVHYEDGDTEHMPAEQLERWLQPLAQTAVPDDVRALRVGLGPAGVASISTDSAKCSICMSNFGELPSDTPVVKLPRCEHVFCRHCIEGWFSSSTANSCPACRTVYSGIRRCTVLTAGAVLVAEASLAGELQNNRKRTLENIQTASLSSEDEGSLSARRRSSRSSETVKTYDPEAEADRPQFAGKLALESVAGSVADHALDCEASVRDRASSDIQDAVIVPEPERSPIGIATVGPARIELWDVRQQLWIEMYLVLDAAGSTAHLFVTMDQATRAGQGSKPAAIIAHQPRVMPDDSATGFQLLYPPEHCVQCHTATDVRAALIARCQYSAVDDMAGLQAEFPRPAFQSDAELASTEAVDQLYIVEAIHKTRVAKDGTTREYLVSWKGFDETENTWEPEANLEGNVYLAQFKAKAGKTNSPVISRADELHTPFAVSEMCFGDVEKGMEYESVWTDETGTQTWFRVAVVYLSDTVAVLHYQDTGEQETLFRADWAPGCLRYKCAFIYRPDYRPEPEAGLPEATTHYEEPQLTAAPASTEAANGLGVDDLRPVSSAGFHIDALGQSHSD